jgi:PelA/Pel-15E family pectate lyase
MMDRPSMKRHWITLLCWSLFLYATAVAAQPSVPLPLTKKAAVGSGGWQERLKTATALEGVRGSDELNVQASNALRKAAAYFTTHVATNGGYLWWYSPDLSKRAGEGEASHTEIWVQPPGTPTVGLAYLYAYEKTGEETYLEAAKAAADALIWGQLECGGWDYSIDFDPKRSQRWYYRHDVDKGIDGAKRRNRATFDDNTTQSALRFIMAVDRTTGNEGKYHEAAMYGLSFMLKSQFENGAWPQRYPLDAKGYSRWYTFNDGAINDCIQTMLDAYQIYGDAKYLDSARRGGDFIIASQLPALQAGWAQQYDYDMKPAWARKFEPPSVCSAVTARNITMLADLYLVTGDVKYLDPIPKAIDWLRQSEISPGRWARFYELGTNRPLYFNKKYELVYTDDDLPTHYSFQGSWGNKPIAYYERVKSKGREKYRTDENAPLSDDARRALQEDLSQKVQTIIAQQDEQGRWLTEGKIQTRTFSQNIRILSDYIALTR